MTSENTGCVSTSTFAFSVGILTGVTSLAVGIKIFAINAGIKRYESVIKKYKEKHDKTALLQKTKL